MNKRKIKLFSKIFFLLLVIQLAVLAGHILLQNADNSLSSVTAIIISVISFPISFISSDLPFYSSEGLYAKLIFWGLNLIIQTIAIYGGMRVIKRTKKNN